MSNKRVSTVRLVWLEAFVESANTGSYKEAGARLDLDPTVIKRYVGSLENWLNFKLVQIEAKKVTLTKSGKSFLERADAIIRILGASRKPVFTLSKPDNDPSSYLEDVVDASFEEIEWLTDQPFKMVK